jgi:RES domain
MRPSEQIIAKLIELKEDNSISSYAHIKNILKNQVIPIASSEFKPFKLIRYRKHSIEDNFYEKSVDLSYRNDILNINKFGRLNEPGQGFFYCNDNENQSTGIAEIVSVFRGNEESNEEILTIGAWNVNKNLKLAVILPNNYNLGLNKEFDKIKEDYNKFYDSEDFEEVKILNEFIANEFTLDLEKHKSNYKITCAYSNYIKEQFPEIDGIIYGSVKSEFNGTNIVLWPEVVEEKIEFFAARKSIFKRIADKNFVEINTFDSKSYDYENDKIIW